MQEERDIVEIFQVLWLQWKYMREEEGEREREIERERESEREIMQIECMNQKRKKSLERAVAMIMAAIVETKRNAKLGKMLEMSPEI